MGLRRIPILGWFASLALNLQNWCWEKRPAITLRLSNSIVIGGPTFLIQLLIFTALTRRDVDFDKANWSSAITVAVPVYILSRKITWSDRLEDMTRRRRTVTYVPLFFLFLVTKVTIVLKSIVAGYLHNQEVSGVISLVISQIMFMALSFVIADNFTFRLMTWVIGRICPAKIEKVIQIPPEEGAA